MWLTEGKQGFHSECNLLTSWLIVVIIKRFGLGLDETSVSFVQT